MKQPLVSIIVPTYNSAAFLDACLTSIRAQTYEPIELLVVDNNSTDDTKAIARRYTDHVYNRGPERSAQRNYGAKRSAGDYVLFIDSDMELAAGVVAACVAHVRRDPTVKGLIIPEVSFGEGFWAQCKKLERSFYVGVDWIEGARFIERRLFERLHGYNTALVSGEDWDLSNRVRQAGTVGRIEEFIYHNEGRVSLRKLIKKKGYYASHISHYVSANAGSTSTGNEISNVFRRFGLFFSRPVMLFKKPHVGLGMLFMKACEYGFGAVGYLRAKSS